MGEFFKGWRRKTGLVTLVMACVLTTAWVRSLVVSDTIAFKAIGGNVRGHLVRSHEQSIRIVRWVGGARYPSVDEKETLLSVPYWSLVLPLTLLSAWLILGKRQKPRAKQADAT